MYTFDGKEVHFIRLSVKGFTHSEENKLRECIYNINLEVDQILPHTNKSASGIKGSTSGVNISRKNNSVKNSITGFYKNDIKAPEKGTENSLKTPEKAVRYSLNKDGNNNLYWEIESHKDIFKGLKTVREYVSIFALKKRCKSRGVHV